MDLRISQARYIAAVSLAVDVKDVRKYLTGVHVTLLPGGGGARITASNGHILLRADDESTICNGDFPASIVQFTPDQLRAFKKKSNLDKPVDLTIVDDKTMRVEFDYTTSNAVIIDGVFPDVGRVIPELTDRQPLANAIPPALDQDYVAIMCTAARTMSDRASIRLHYSDALNSVRVSFPQSPAALGVVMPMRIK